MNPLARLVFPPIRWRPSTGYDHARAMIEETLALGVGGYILFGGEAGAARALTDELRAASAHPLLIASDFERGAGQQIDDLTQLPPPAALGFLDDVEKTARCAAITAREARAVGVNWVYAPVADLDLEPKNPIIQTRAFGDDVDRVSRHVAAWIHAAQHGGVLACAKHYPGHGRTEVDSHEALPVVNADRAAFERTDLAPFAAAVAAGVGSVMTAHVAYPAWDTTGLPATLSPTILGHLRTEMGYDGLIVTDALNMEGALRGGGEAEASSVAVAAGCDALLYLRDPAAVVARLDMDARRPEARARLDDAVERIARAADLATRRPAEARVDDDPAFAAALADLAVHVLRGTTLDLPTPLKFDIVDDDAGGPYVTGPRDHFERTLRSAGVDLGRGGARIVLVYATPLSWKGRGGLGAQSLAALERLLPAARLVVVFGSPRIAAQIGGDAPVVCAWWGDELMQAAAARWVLQRVKDG